MHTCRLSGKREGEGRKGEEGRAYTNAVVFKIYTLVMLDYTWMIKVNLGQSHCR